MFAIVICLVLLMCTLTKRCYIQCHNSINTFYRCDNKYCMIIVLSDIRPEYL